MRRCAKKGCGVILLDTDETCPVCGGDTEYAGTGKMEKQKYDPNEARVVVRRKRGSRLGTLILLIIGGFLIYYAYGQIAGSDTPDKPDTRYGDGLLEYLTREKKK